MRPELAKAAVALLQGQLVVEKRMRPHVPSRSSILSASTRGAGGALTCACLALTACDEPLGNGNVEHHSAPVPKAQTSPPNPSASASSSAAASESVASAESAADAGKLAEEAYNGPYLAALYLQTPVLTEMEWPKEDGKNRDGKFIRAGYIRQGSRVPVIAKPHKKSNCSDGWYELVRGGYVCGKYATIDMNHPRVKNAPKAPDLAAPLPYQYGYNTQNGTPLYRTVPSKDERVKLEPWLATKRKGKRVIEDVVPASEDVEGVQDAGAPSTPWYLRDYDAGSKPMVTLDELRGDGPMARRMVKGFYLALDHSFGTQNGTYWKTTGGLLAPYDKIWVQKALTDFHGTWISGGGANSNEPTTETAPTDKLPKIEGTPTFAFVLSTRAKKYNVDRDTKKASAVEAIPRFAFVTLSGETVTYGGTRYDETNDGVWLKAIDLAKTHPGDPPEGLESGEKWIDVALSTQTLVAFEGTTPVYATLMSSGRRNKEKDKDHPTPPGTFRVREKHVAATMDGDGAADGPYSIEDVPWIMYFNGSYALHGAFWHANFGRQQSHGCVNLAPQDAKTLFDWTEPHLPDGWHGVNATAEKKGTRIVVHE